MPLPWPVRSALSAALKEQPAVGGPGWKAALEVGIAGWRERRRTAAPDPLADDPLADDPPPGADDDFGDDPDAADEATLRRRLDLWIPTAPPLAGDGRPAMHLALLAESIEQWARGRGGASGNAGLLGASAVARAAAGALRALDPVRRVTRLEARQLYDLAVGAGHAAPQDAEVGAPLLLDDPAAVPGNVGTIAWFGVIAGAAEAGAALRWTPEERAALSAAGCELDADGALRRREQRAWLRPCGSRATGWCS